MEIAGKTYWLIGASAGLGAALARKMDRAGAHLILSARSGDALIRLAAELNHARPVVIDVTDSASVAAAAREAGAIDGVIYLAGTYDPMRAQNWNTERSLAMVDVNFAGAIRVLGAVLPGLLSANSGHIVLIGSLAAYRGLPGAIGYGASKAALMSLGESLYVDLRTTAIKVQIINPGFIRSRLTAKNDFHMPQLMSADFAADQVLRAMASGRVITAFPRPFAWLFQLMRLMPIKISRAILGR